MVSNDEERYTVIGFSQNLHGDGTGIIEIDVSNGNIKVQWNGYEHRLTIEAAVEAYMEVHYHQNKN